MLKRKEFILGAAVGLTFAAAATAGGVITWPGANAETKPAVSGRLIPSAGAPGLAFAPPQGAPLSFADIFAQVSPAVVQIDVKTRIQRPQGGVFSIPGLPFQFQTPPGAQGPDDEEGGEPDSMLSEGAGSGFLITADGYIVTNNHVVENAEEITVKLSDERELKAKLIGRDVKTDLAVIKVEGANFPFVSFEEAAEPRVGDWVIAVGNPFGLGGTATAGIVSAKARDIDPQSYNDFIQIDAAINRGNSGGPTFDIYGRVIGVNSAIFSPSGGSVGIGFAIPATIAKNVTDQLMRGETIQRGYLGVGIRGLSPEQFEALGMPGDFKGAVVESITPSGPAQKAGLREGDFIVSVNGEEVENSTEVTRKVAAVRPGEEMRLGVLRDGRTLNLTALAGTRPPEDELLAQDGQGRGGNDQATPRGIAGDAVEGLTLAPLTDALRERYRIADSVSGLVITDVVASSAAGEQGFRQGFVIVRADNKAVRNVSDFKAAVEAVRSSNRPGVLVLVWTPQGSENQILPLAKATDN